MKQTNELTEQELDAVAGGMPEPCIIRDYCCFCKGQQSVSDCGECQIKPTDMNGQLLPANRFYCKNCGQFFYKARRDGKIVYYSGNFAPVN